MSAGANTLSVLIVEDSEDDAQLVVRELRRHGYSPTVQVVDTANEFSRMLRTRDWQIIVADYALPQFSALAALALLKKSGVHTPFIVVSGTIGEEKAVEILKLGAADYVPKGNLPRLIPVIERELREVEVRRERAEAEAARVEAIGRLEESEQKYRTLVEQLPAITYVAAADSTSTTLYISPAVERILGYSPEAYRADPDLWANSLHPEDRDQTLAAVATAHATGEPFATEYRLIARDGHSVWIHDEAALVQGNDGRPLVLQGVMLDISAQREAERALERKGAYFQSLIEHSSDLITVVEGDGHITFQSPSVQVVLGYDPAELIGSDFFAIVHLEDLQNALRLLDNGSDDGPPVRTEFRAKAKDGSWRQFEAVANQALFDDERLTIINSRDVTERKQAEDSTRRQLRRMTALNRIGTAATASADLQLTLSIVCEQIRSQLAVQAVDILTVNAKTKRLCFAAESGFRRSDFSSFELGLFEGVAGRVALERQALQMDELTEFIRRDALASEGLLSYHGMPLIAKGQLKGVLEVFDSERIRLSAGRSAFLEAAAAQAALAIDESLLFHELQRSSDELSLAYDATLEGWVKALDLRDHETEGHSLRVVRITESLALSMGIGEGELLHIRRGALLHDIGKMAVPDGILRKPGPLTEEEWALMRKHPEFARDWLAPIRYLRQSIDIPYCHHERWDGSGYPRGLKGLEIPTPARIFSIVDVWDALRSDRPYRPAWTVETTLSYLQEQRGVMFDPDVVDAFLQLDPAIFNGAAL